MKTIYIVGLNYLNGFHICPINFYYASGKHGALKTKKSRYGNNEIRREIQITIGSGDLQTEDAFCCSYDENTGRRFFENVNILSEITGLNKNPIYRACVILMTVVLL